MLPAHACLTERVAPLILVVCLSLCGRPVLAGPHAGPFGSRSTADTSPGVLTALTQPPQDTGAQQQQHLVAYVPPQLAVLLRQLAAELAGDVQAAAAAAPAAGQGAVMSGAGGGGVSYDVAASALQVRLPVTVSV